MNNVPSTSIGTKSELINNIVKWMPLFVAGSAIGVSIIALKEIKNTRRDLIKLTTEQQNKPIEPPDDTLFKKIEQMDGQIRKISMFLSELEQKKQRENVQVREPIIIKKIINDYEEKVKEENVKEENVKQYQKEKIIEITDDDEYEYEEVTDDEN